MKPTALKELQTALQYLNIIHDDNGDLTAEEVKFSVGEAIRYIQGAIFSETPSTATNSTSTR